MGWPINRDIAYNFDALFALSNDAGHVVCLSDRDIDILISSLRFAHWPTRWVDSEERILRDNGRVTDLYLANDYIAELEEKLMSSCGSEIRAGLEAVAAGIMALAQKPCCNDQTVINIYQGTSPGGNQIYGTQPPSAGNTSGLDPATDPPPEGYDTWEEYYTDKCQKANYVADSLISTITNISFLSVVNEIGLAALLIAAAVGAVVLPIAAIPVIVGLLLANSTLIAALGLVGSYMSDHREDLVCGLFLSENSGDAVDVFAGFIDEALAAVVVATELHPAIRTIALIIASTDAINKLWDATVKVEYANADCSGCDTSQSCADFSAYDHGNITGVEDLGDGQYRVTVASTPGFNSRGEVSIETPFEGCCMWLNAPVELVSGGSSAYGRSFTRCDGTTGTDAITSLAVPVEGWYKRIKYWGANTSPFTLRFTVCTLQDASQSDPEPYPCNQT
jgi:hypothetical protein